ncbi:MAG: hypothetical protein ACKO9I_18895 [Sphaerospermopsis kisseleviana]
MTVIRSDRLAALRSDRHLRKTNISLLGMGGIIDSYPHGGARE